MVSTNSYTLQGRFYRHLSHLAMVFVNYSQVKWKRRCWRQFFVRARTRPTLKIQANVRCFINKFYFASKLETIVFVQRWSELVFFEPWLSLSQPNCPCLHESNLSRVCWHRTVLEWQVLRKILGSIFFQLTEELNPEWPYDKRERHLFAMPLPHKFHLTLSIEL